MDGFITIVGGVTAGLLSLAIAFAAWAWLNHVLENRRRNLRDEAYDLAVMKIGKQMSNGAHWYFERGNDAAAILVKEIGEHMMRWGVYDEDRIRKNWREARVRAPESPAEGRAGV